MKARRFLWLVVAAMLSVGVVSCDKENNENQNQNTAQWVDLGLPSGLLWATCNLGANAPEEYGNYYAWGETQPKEEDYNWRTYRYCTVDGEGNLQTLTKYNTDTHYGTVDSLTVLQSADDAATAALGSGARTPTKAEWEELVINCNSTWTTKNGVNGRLLTGPNGNTLFLPAAGGRWGDELYGVGALGYYWSSSLDMDDPGSAWNFYFESGGRLMGSGRRNGGFSVRFVRQN